MLAVVMNRLNRKLVHPQISQISVLREIIRTAVLALAVGLAIPAVLTTTGCGPHATTATVPASTVPTATTPNSPQSTVALANKTVVDTANAAVDTVIALRNSGKLSPANTTTIENWLGLVATTSKSIGLILAKPEPWAAQKTEILALLVTVTAPTIATSADPSATVLIAQIMTLVNQIKTQVQP